jgi:hypothetical protein
LPIPFIAGQFGFGEKTYLSTMAKEIIFHLADSRTGRKLIITSDSSELLTKLHHDLRQSQLHVTDGLYTDRTKSLALDKNITGLEDSVLGTLHPMPIMKKPQENTANQVKSTTMDNQVSLTASSKTKIDEKPKAEKVSEVFSDFQNSYAFKQSNSEQVATRGGVKDPRAPEPLNATPDTVTFNHSINQKAEEKDKPQHPTQHGAESPPLNEPLQGALPENLFRRKKSSPETLKANPPIAATDNLAFTKDANTSQDPSLKEKVLTSSNEGLSTHQRSIETSDAIVQNQVEKKSTISPVLSHDPLNITLSAVPDKPFDNSLAPAPATTTTALEKDSNQAISNTESGQKSDKAAVETLATQPDLHKPSQVSDPAPLDPIFMVQPSQEEAKTESMPYFVPEASAVKPQLFSTETILEPQVGEKANNDHPAMAEKLADQSTLAASKISEAGLSENHEEMNPSNPGEDHPDEGDHQPKGKKKKGKKK